MIELRLLGGADLSGVDEAAAAALLVQSKSVAALAWLALERGRPFHRRDRVAELLWPELDQEHARAVLRKVVQTEDWKNDLEANFWVDAYSPASEAKRIFDREYEEFRTILTELGMAK